MIQLIAFGLSAAGLVWLIMRALHIAKLKRYAQRFENVYVVSCHPNGNTPQLDFLDEFCVYCNHSDVLQVAKEERDFLAKAGNKFLGAEIKGSARIKVIPIIFRDGFPNESWEDFQDRAAKQIADDRQKRHDNLRVDLNWYQTNHCKQVVS